MKEDVVHGVGYIYKKKEKKENGALVYVWQQDINTKKLSIFIYIKGSHDYV